MSHGRDALGPRFAARAFVLLAWLTVSAVVIQVYLAGYALLADAAAWTWHTTFVHVVEPLPFLMALVAWLGRGPRRLLVLSLTLIGLVWLQYAFVAAPLGLVRALHPANALMIFAVALVTVRDAGARWLHAGRAPPASDATPHA